MGDIEEVQITRFLVEGHEFDSRAKAEAFIIQDDIRKAVARFMKDIPFPTDNVKAEVKISLENMALEGSLEKLALKIAKIRSSLYPKASSHR